MVPAIQVVILSAYEDAGLIRDAERAGVHSYLVKGCTPSLIRDVLEGACAQATELRDRART